VKSVSEAAWAAPADRGLEKLGSVSYWTDISVLPVARAQTIALLELTSPLLTANTVTGGVATDAGFCVTLEVQLRRIMLRSMHPSIDRSIDKPPLLF
jgi:hypothetical protein